MTEEINEEEIKRQVEELLSFGKEYFNYITECSEIYHIEDEHRNEIFEMVKTRELIFLYEEKQDLIDGVLFYCDLHDKIEKVKTLSELKQVIKFFYIDNKTSPHTTTYYNLLGALMKINIHHIWQLAYHLHPRLRSSPEEALNDIAYPIECSQKIVKDIIKEFNNEEV